MIRDTPLIAPVRLAGNPVHLLSMGLGSGLAPRAPGTAGTLAAIPFAWLAQQVDLWGYIAICVAIMLVGVWSSARTALALGVHDHKAIVIDEFAGFFITMVAVPFSLLTVALGFALFRLLDILKPWPISAIDRSLHGGLGIMLDDVLAGLAACAILHGLLWSWPALLP